MDKKTEVEKWSENYPEFISGFSSFMAVLVEGVSKHLESIKNKSCFDTFGDISPLGKWLECYEDDSFTIKYITRFYQENIGGPEFSPDNVDTIINFPNTKDKNDQDHEEKGGLNLNSQSEEFEKIIIDSFKVLTEKYRNNLFDQEYDKNSKLQDIGSQFLMTVYLPCYLFYAESPYEIFKKAQKGSLESIDKILRIDPSVLGDPIILKQFHIASKQEDRTAFNTFTFALRNPPKGKVTLQKIKYKFAGAIGAVSKKAGHQLTAPEIENLFTALSIDLNRPDLEFVESDDVYNESVAQQVRRGNQFWTSEKHPYKK